MNFSSPLFLFAFLPGTFVLYFLAGSRLRYKVFMAASLIFALWAGPFLFPVILISTGVNFLLGISLQKRRDKQQDYKKTLFWGFAFNIAMLLGSKLLVAYGPGWIYSIKSAFPESLVAEFEQYLLKSIALPVGISFYSFGAILYLKDIAAGRSSAETRLSVFSLFMTAFPKVVAGPIARFSDLAGQFGAREIDWNLAGRGARRFITGLAKKTIIADKLSLLVDNGVFDQALPNLSTPAAWLVLVCFSLQIYFDFSGYSDMAIGLGMIFGLRLPENFNFPYLSKSISEFWRRWHMTLSAWFREIVFYPLERKRVGGSRWSNQFVNALIVFFLTGLWHGVTLNFLIWGMLHGLAICLEVSPLGKGLRKLPSFFQHVYTILILMIGWVFFRSNSPSYAFSFLKTLSGFATNAQVTPYSVFAPPSTGLWITLALALFFSFPVSEWLENRLKNLSPAHSGWIQVGIHLFLLAGSLVALAGSTFQPYIYGNF
jgi:alginate O-acetyltransferase complex protein AlgI